MYGIRHRDVVPFPEAFDVHVFRATDSRCQYVYHRDKYCPQERRRENLLVFLNDDRLGASGQRIAEDDAAFL